MDRPVFEIFAAADRRTLIEALRDYQPKHASRIQLIAGLACLAEAGLLDRIYDEGSDSGDVRQRDHQPDLHSSEHAQNELVSVVIVSYNSRAWLPDCLDSLAGQHYAPIEIVVVDNASQDGSADWVEERSQVDGLDSPIHILRLSQTTSLAQAINAGIQSASGRYYLLLNPDVRLEREAIAQMVKVARERPQCAAVAAKLRLLWTPSFLNGAGNLVGAISWGSDIGLGHLDLGQFAAWDEIPSACFAAALIPAEMIALVGKLSESFPMYYEDSEWCYRARSFGYSINLAPDALVYHAYSARNRSNEFPAGKELPGISPLKLRRVTSGRLRFITLINQAGYFWSFFFNYLLEDLFRTLISALPSKNNYNARLEKAGAFLYGWMDYLASMIDPRSRAALLAERNAIQARRKLSNRALYRLQRQAPAPLIRDGLPLLTWDAICNDYLPLIAQAKTRPLPEFNRQMMTSDGLDHLATELDQLFAANHERPNGFSRSIHILHSAGWAALLRHLGRRIQWRMMNP